MWVTFQIRSVRLSTKNISANRKANANKYVLFSTKGSCEPTDSSSSPPIAVNGLIACIKSLAMTQAPSFSER